jgi:hypothetical protein
MSDLILYTLAKCLKKRNVDRGVKHVNLTHVIFSFVNKYIIKIVDIAMNCSSFYC